MRLLEARWSMTLQRLLDIDFIMNKQQPGNHPTVEAADSRIRFNLTQNSLSCFISQRPRSSSAHRRHAKTSSGQDPLIQVLQGRSATKPNSSPYFDFCFDHKLLFTKYGSTEMYVDEDPSPSKEQLAASDADDSSVSEVVSQCMRAISEDTADNSLANERMLSSSQVYQNVANELSRSRSRLGIEEPIFNILPSTSQQDGRTTLMLRNIPNKYTQQMVLQQVEQAGLENKYDFFYLPIDFKNDCNVGYAFINLVDVRFVSKIYEKFHGKKWPRFNSEKICQVCYARIQGTLQLLNHFRFSNTLQRDNRSRPLIFLNLALSEERTKGGKQNTSSTI